MPEPFDFSNPSSGDRFRNYTEEYELRFENLTFEILNLVPKDDYTAWINEYTEKERTSEERIPPLTILDFVTEFDISKDQLLSVIAEDNDPSWTITREDVDVIYSGNMELVSKTFINEYAVLHNNKIYTPKWLYEHTAAEYIEAGLSDDEVSYAMEKMKDLPFIADAKKAIENKYGKFQAAIKEMAVTSEEDIGDYSQTIPPQEKNLDSYTFNANPKVFSCTITDNNLTDDEKTKAAAKLLTEDYIKDFSESSDKYSFRILEYQNVSVDFIQRTVDRPTLDTSIYSISNGIGDMEMSENAWVIDIDAEIKFSGSFGFVSSAELDGENVWNHIPVQGMSEKYLLYRQDDTFYLWSRNVYHYERQNR
ncbi:MAG: hypothetical protein NC203_12030 [Firmicutes bacterium]|nr:hypothetical protein [[Eubacterium] siraeum]MCM1489082.1 hypothetical protein [Bacillota bacterium]